ncbi:hypothetical protein ACIA5D_44450 [Actinoplanes sp. NPDC051513]|uniref:hypothetical protein n=1 Tax=Actinoplanes sp. NPDC051513 TaxID=3363908 RepID=UPI00378A8E37
MWASFGLMAAAAGLLVSAPLPASARAVEGSTHLSVSTTDAKGHVGDTVSIRVTITNHGPAVEPEWALTGVQTQVGTKFASGTGCRPDPDGGQYCSSPGPLAVGKSQTVVLHYKIVKTLPHPDWEMAGFSFYEALDRKGGTDDVDLSFHVSILGTATPATKPSTNRTPATARSTSASTGRAPAARRTASPAPSRAGTTTASTSEPAAMLAAPQTDPTPSLTAAVLPKIEDAGFTANASRTAWAVAAGGIALIGSTAFALLARARRRRARAAASDIPAL